VYSSAVVIQRHREGIRESAAIARANFTAELRHVDPANLERIDICKAQCLNRECPQINIAGRGIEISPRRSDSGRSCSEIRNVSVVAGVSNSERDVAVGVQEERVPHAVGTAYRSA